MAPRETENNAYAKFWGDKQRALWYVMVFLEWSINQRKRNKPSCSQAWNTFIGFETVKRAVNQFKTR